MIPLIDDQLAAEAALLVGVPLTARRRLLGGQRAETLLVDDAADARYVVRMFPEHDPAPEHEVQVLGSLDALGDLVPRVVAADLGRAGPILVTTHLPGGPPAPDLPLVVVASEMARALAEVHALSGDGLRTTPASPPPGTTAIARRARDAWGSLDLGDPVLTHFDFWCGNTLWTGDALTGVVDWSGARRGPRGVDVAWCRQDLVLLGSHRAADVFLDEYRRRSGHPCHDVSAWDLQAAALADSDVETWSENYDGIGRPEMSADVLRARLARWQDDL